MLLRAMPCPDCLCESCTLLEDDFNRADSDTVGNGWTEVTGDWDIISSEMVVKGAVTRGVVTHSTTFTDGKGSITVTIVANSAMSAQVLGGYTDANNYIIGRWAFLAGEGRMQLVERVGGTETVLAGTTIVPGEGIGVEATVRLCWDGIAATVEHLGSSERLTAATTLTGQAGVGVAFLASSAVELDVRNVVLANIGATNDDCEPCGSRCETCDPVYTGGFDVDISGFLATGACADCPDLDGLYSLEGPPTISELGRCRWELSFTAVCGIDKIIVEIYENSGDYFIEVKLLSAGVPDTQPAYSWKQNLGATAPDCGDFTDLDVPDAIAFDVNCGGFESTTCTVTAT